MQVQLNGKSYYVYRFSGGEYEDVWEDWYLHEELLDGEGIKERIRAVLPELMKRHEQFLAAQKEWEDTRREYVLRQIGPVPQYVLEAFPNRASQDYLIRQFVHCEENELVYRNVGWCAFPREQRLTLIEGITKDDYLRVTGQHSDQFDYYECALALAGFVELKPAVEFEPNPYGYDHSFTGVCSMVGAEYVP